MDLDDAPCGCGAPLRRMRRRWWMRLFWRRRLYACTACDRVMFLPRRGARRG